MSEVQAEGQLAMQLRWAIRFMQPILDDPLVTDLHINGAGHNGNTQVFIKRSGKRERRTIDLTAQQLRQIGSAAAVLGRGQLSERMPFSPGRFPDRQRVQLACEPAVPEGKYALSVRSGFRKSPTPSDLEKWGVFGDTEPSETARPRAGTEELLAMKAARQWRMMIETLYLYGYSGVFAGPVNSGKAQPDHSMVLTPVGFKTIASLAPGDLVLAPDGKSAPVTGVFPQGEKPIFRVTFEDGRQTECCGDHLWKVWGHGGWRVLPLNKVAERFIRNTRYKDITAIPLASDSLDLPPQDLPIAPYVLGALLGDGGFSQHYVCLTTPDQFILNKVLYQTPDAVAVFQNGVDGINFRLATKAGIRGSPGSIRSGLIAMGLRGLRSHEKFVPPAYKNGSLEQRLGVLQGIMDTDGSVDQQGCGATCTTTSPQLAKDIQELAWSVGAIASIKNRQTYFTHKGVKKAGKPSFRVNIKHPDASKIFSLPRHLEKFRPRKKSLRLRITDISPVGTMPARCISIDHPDHLYVTDNYIVTHNSTNLLSFFHSVPDDRRILTVQDTEELDLMPQHDVVHFLYPKDTGGVAQHTAENCIQAALRMDMDEIVNGEIRDGAAWALMRAGRSGHPFKTSCHASSAEGAFLSLLAMAKEHKVARSFNTEDLMATFMQLIDFVVFSEVVDGNRKVTQIWFDPASKKGIPKSIDNELKMEADE